MLPILAMLPALPSIPVPTWFIEIIGKKLALEAKAYIENPDHLVTLKAHVRDWLLSEVKTRGIAAEWVKDLEEVLDALLGIAPVGSVKVVGNGTDVQVLPTGTPDLTPATAAAATDAPHT